MFYRKIINLLSLSKGPESAVFRESGSCLKKARSAHAVSPSKRGGPARRNIARAISAPRPGQGQCMRNDQWLSLMQGPAAARVVVARQPERLPARHRYRAPRWAPTENRASDRIIASREAKSPTFFKQDIALALFPPALVDAL